jgi:F-type H+-transporting ATPase subunit gamma
VETLRALKRRIRSVEKTKQITKAMEMVAAAKLRKAQALVESARPYAHKMQEILESLAGAAALTHPLFEKREVKKVVILVLTSDGGLCGSYNTNIIRRLNEELGNYVPDSVCLYLIGKKGYEHYRRRRWTIREKILDLAGNLDLMRVRSISKELTDLFLTGEVDQVKLLYTRFLSTITYRVALENLLPLEDPRRKEEVRRRLEYIFEPSPASIFDGLLPRYCVTRIRTALAESFASEHGARMIAMGAAARNAEEMMEHLTRLRNRARQASITKEMLEIVAGAEALK